MATTRQCQVVAGFGTRSRWLGGALEFRERNGELMGEYNMAATDYRTTFKGGRSFPDVQWRIKGDLLSRNGEPVADLSAVTAGEYLYSRGQFSLHRRLTIESSLGTAAIMIHYLRRKDPDVMLALSTRVLHRVAERSPSARIHIGGGRSQVMANFAVAMFFLGVGAWFLSQSYGDDTFLTLMAIPFILAGLWRGVLARPWGHERLLVSADEAITALPKGPYSFTQRWRATGSSSD